MSTCSDTFAEAYAIGKDVSPEFPNQSNQDELITITVFDTVGRFMYEYICSRCLKTIVTGTGNTVVVRCSSCGTFHELQKLQQTMKVEVETSDLPDYLRVLDYYDLMKLYS